MGLIQEYSPSHDMDQFAYEHLLRNTEWLSDCDWMFDKSESFEYTVNYLIVVHPIYISYLFQSMMMINV